jgi:hypothetical protein
MIKTIPKPSKANKILVVDVIAEDMEEQELGPKLYLFSIASFDGEEFTGYTDMILSAQGLKPPDDLKKIEDKIIDQVYYEGYTLVVPSKDIAEKLYLAGLRKLPELIKTSGIEAFPIIEKILGYPIPMQPLMDAARNIAEEAKNAPGLEEVHQRIMNIKEKGYKKLFPAEKKLVTDYLKLRASALYIGFLLQYSKELGT